MHDPHLRARAAAPHLFRDDVRTFAVVDGAGTPKLLERLAANGPEHVCLYRGELEPDLAEAAPWLVALERDDPFVDWLVGERWGTNWGLVVQADAELPDLRRHFRRLMMVRLPDGQAVYFRWYDPRVLRTYLPTCDRRERDQMFGPVDAFVMEAGADDALIRMERSADGLATTRLHVTG